MRKKKAERAKGAEGRSRRHWQKRRRAFSHSLRAICCFAMGGRPVLIAIKQAPAASPKNRGLGQLVDLAASSAASSAALQRRLPQSRSQYAATSQGGLGVQTALPHGIEQLRTASK